MKLNPELTIPGYFPFRLIKIYNYNLHDQEETPTDMKVVLEISKRLKKGGSAPLFNKPV